MENDDTKAASGRPHFLLRQVVVPSWLQAILLVTYAYVFIRLLIANPLWLILGICASIAFGALILAPLRRRAGQGTDADDDAEADAAPTVEAAVSIRWRQFRTYQVWHLVVLVVASALVLLDAAGIPTP